jgi:hypothetical protein
MRKRLVIIACCLTLLITAVTIGAAQLAAPTPAGVSLGAVYFTVPDVEKHKKIWVDNMGAKPVMIGKTEMLKMPGVFIVLSKGTPDTTAGLVDHLGIWAKDLDPTRAKLTAAGIETAPKAQFVNLPDNVRLEFVDDPAGPDVPTAQHIHYFAPTPGAEARGWYVKMFGATENGRRGGAVPSALFTTPDKWISVDFTAPRGGGGRGAGRGGAPAGAAGAAPAAAPPAAPAGPGPNKGKVLDRFALEAKGIEALVKKLESEGVKITKQVSTNADGLKTAMFVDITGNEVELIEGLAGK